jgi:hypothetical protein
MAEGLLAKLEQIAARESGSWRKDALFLAAGMAG